MPTDESVRRAKLIVLGAICESALAVFLNDDIESPQAIRRLVMCLRLGRTRASSTPALRKCESYRSAYRGNRLLGGVDPKKLTSRNNSYR